ncbi:BgTH12-02340 [Blumeria graminis f. sp. triticale]|uniref:BgtE-5679 n=3 Tax=Blumeria graminis TaxID=34373 RepID=A0A061HH54_BLUGR|nr:putative secreted effector protein [Blumeria graminis f. sp. tritici 96224]CAD6502099.1 BgTH12-02340 [Blumeria graminis f. sp. triticale]VDB86088.1 BgtE-5679 [Blumeria graminis f. sp. tritici]
MRLTNILILFACSITDVDAELKYWRIQQGAKCGASIYRQETLEDAIKPHCRINSDGKPEIILTDDMKRSYIIPEPPTPLYYLPLPSVDANGEIVSKEPTDYHVAVDPYCEFNVVTEVMSVADDGITVDNEMRKDCVPDKPFT